MTLPYIADDVIFCHLFTVKHILPADVKSASKSEVYALIRPNGKIFYIDVKCRHLITLANQL